MSFERLNTFVQRLDIHKKSSYYVNTDIQRSANALLKSIEKDPEKFQKQFRKYPERIRQLHEEIVQRTDEVEAGGGFRRWGWFKSSTKKALVNLNKCISLLIPKRNTKYDKQIQLRVSTDTPSGPRLELKARLKGLETTTINMHERPEDLVKLKCLTHNSRLYLIGHGMVNGRFLNSRANGRYSVNDIVNTLVEYAPQLIKKEHELNNGKRLKISLSVCHGAEKENKHKFDASFAESLSLALYAAGIPAEVIGRNGSVRVQREKMTIKKLVDGEYQTAGSKFSYITKKDPATKFVITTTTDVYGKTSKATKRKKDSLQNITSMWRPLWTRPLRYRRSRDINVS